MKKFFLSVAVMLAAVSINANAMSDSFIFHSTDEELAEKLNNTWTQEDIIQQLCYLAASVANDFGSNSPELNKYWNAVYDNRFMDAIHIVKELKIQQDIQQDDDNDASNCKPLGAFGLNFD